MLEGRKGNPIINILSHGSAELKAVLHGTWNPMFPVYFNGREAADETENDNAC